jgi:hypothetical protein
MRYIFFLTEIPSGARVVLDCEATDILQEIQEHMVILSEDPTIKFPPYVSLFFYQHFTCMKIATELAKLTFS